MSQTGVPVRVVVVDDHAMFRSGVRAELAASGAGQVDVVAEAADVDEAVAAVQAQRPDVVLLDVHLAAEHTDKLLARMRSDGIPVALVTGSVDVEKYRRAADGVLTKPFAPQDLVDLARRLAKVSS